jgi:hypothetical protein
LHPSVGTGKYAFAMSHRFNLPTRLIIAGASLCAQGFVATLLFGWLLLFNIAAAAVPAFEAEERPDRIVVSWGGQPVAHYIFQDEKILRPYFAHVQGDVRLPSAAEPQPNRGRLEWGTT